MAVTDEAVMKIRELIISGKLQPGDQLPQEWILADDLGISRNSMREAVRVLEHMRVLTVRHGSGTYVSSLEPAQLLEGISTAVDMMRDHTLREVVEVRQLLEPAATRLAVQRMTPAKLELIRHAFDDHSAQSDIEGLVRCDVAFHSAIVNATDNETLHSLLDGLSSKTIRFRIWGGIVNDDAVGLTIQHHEQIMTAIESGDSHLAEAAALVHVTHARGLLDAYLDEAALENDSHPAPRPKRSTKSTVSMTASQ